MKLNLGFEEYPYEARYSENSPLTTTIRKRAPKHMSKPQAAYGAGKTTTEVAEDLETRYALVEEFVSLEEDYITDLLEDALAQRIEDGIINILDGVPQAEVVRDAQYSPENEADRLAQIENKFKRALSGQRFDWRIAGVPTRRALQGVSHLRKQPFAKGHGPRPSFIDTGMYSRSFRAWIEDD